MSKFRYIVTTYVPTAHADNVREALARAGAGSIGNYSHCSFSSKGVGRFKGEAGSNPTIGKAGRIEKIAEERIEAICGKKELKAVLEAVRVAHPYEEPVVFAVKILTIL
ncbi:hypothetical protein L0Y49_02835 [bacterium]|nr:hypothetical protein [bacterium]